MAPLILVTNDDGIDSPGLHAAIRAVAPLGEVVAVAPKAQQTSMGRSLAVAPDGLHIERAVLPLREPEVVAYSVTASPALAVAHAILRLLPRLPDLCVSGINYGENIGATLTTSGTIGAALEAASLGVPALATSAEVPADISHAGTYVDLDWSASEHFTRLLAERILREGVPSGVALLNLNVPKGATPATPIQLTRQSRKQYYEWARPTPGDDAPGKRLRRQIVHPADGEWEEGDDVTAFARDRHISVTPLDGDLTAPVPEGWAADWR